MTYPPPGPNYPDPTGQWAGQQPQQQPPPGYGQQPGYSTPYSDPTAAPYGSGPPTGQMPPASGMPHQQPVSSVPGSYQQPGPYQQPVSSVPGAYQPVSSVPGYQQPYGAPGFPPPRPGASKAPLIVAVALAVVVVLGIGFALVFVLGGNDEPLAAGATSSPSASPSPSPSPSPSESPSEDSGERLSYQEYDDDWDFKLGEIELSADYVKGWDYEDCTGFERGGALTDQGCEYGVEVTYQAEGGKVRISNLFLVMSDQDAAEDVNKDIDDDDFTLHRESYLKNFSYGKWQRKFSGKYVVVTICTAAKSVSKDKAGKYLHYMNADMTAALSFR